MEYVVTEDVTFVAQWEEAYSVTFYSEKGWINGDSEKKEDKTYVKKDSVYKYKTPSVNDYNGYIFSGWKVDGDDSLYVEDGVDENYGINIKNINEYEVTKDVTFIAQWEKAYNITFYSDEGFYMGRPDEEEHSYQIRCNEKIGDDYYKCGINDYAHRIAGWKIEGDDTLYVERNENLKENEKSISEYVVTGDVRFIAQWEEAYYKVTFYSEEGYLCHYEKGTDGYIGKRVYGGSFEDKYYELLLEKGNEIGSVRAAWGNRNGYKIAGWMIDDNKVLKIEEVWAYIPCEDMTLVAQWKKIDLTVETDINNGSEKSNSNEGKQNTGSDALKNDYKGFASVEKDTSESELKKNEANNIENKQASNFIGDTITYKSIKYKVLTDGKVEYASANNKKLKSVVIPDTISDGNGNKYKVTGIAEKAFKNYKKLTKVTIGKNVTKIGKNAFSGCKKLSNITIKGSSLKSVGKKVIKGINKKATIKVPKKCYTKYKKLFKSKTGYKKTMKIKNN